MVMSAFSLLRDCSTVCPLHVTIPPSFSFSLDCGFFPLCFSSAVSFSLCADCGFPQCDREFVFQVWTVGFSQRDRDCVFQVWTVDFPQCDSEFVFQVWTVDFPQHDRESVFQVWTVGFPQRDCEVSLLPWLNVTVCHCSLCDCELVYFDSVIVSCMTVSYSSA